MKRIINIGLVFIFFLCVSVYLFIDGKQHKIFLENLSLKSLKAPEKIIVFLDNDKKGITIRSEKKAVGFVKGKKHKIKINYSENGEKKEKRAEFETPLNKTVTLELISLISEKKNWIKEE
ncbi:MAG: DUF6672 family protein [Fusobacteriaceae bacterium]